MGNRKYQPLKVVIVMMLGAALIVPPTSASNVIPESFSTDLAEPSQIINHATNTIQQSGLNGSTDWINQVGTDPAIRTLSLNTPGSSAAAVQTGNSSPDAVALTAEELEQAERGVKLQVCADTGNRYYQSGDLKNAVAQWTKAIDLDDSHSILFFNRGIARGRLGEIDLAIQDFQRAIQLEPGEPQGYNSVGYLYYLKEDQPRAIESFSKAIALNPADPQFWFNRSNSYRAVGEEPAAITDLDKAIQLKGDFLEALINRGGMHLKQGTYEQALADFGNALQLDQGNQAVRFNHALAALQLGQNDLATADLSLILENDTSLTLAYELRGAARFQSMDYQGACYDWMVCLERSPENKEIAYQLGLSYLLLENPEQAMMALNQSILADNSYGPAYFQRANLKLQQKEYEAAVEDYSKAIQYEASADNAYFNRGVAYLNLNQTEEAKADFNTALSVTGNDTLKEEVKKVLNLLAESDQS